jgi:hypothetical protein
VCAWGCGEFEGDVGEVIRCGGVWCSSAVHGSGARRRWERRRHAGDAYAESSAWCVVVGAWGWGWERTGMCSVSKGPHVDGEGSGGSEERDEVTRDVLE